MEYDITVISKKVEQEYLFVEKILSEVRKVIVGQKYLLERVLVGILANGHILLEGVPGLAKTLSAKTFSDCIDTKFKRIQFTPDLLPADLIGTLVYNQKDGSFAPRKGPIFTNILLADEINRAPAKVQSALLEAMQERQVTIGNTTYPLEEPFMVLATQNPIEQEGTYPLPEAQVDRFMLKLKIDYPAKEEEKEILERMTVGTIPKAGKVINPSDIMKARKVISEIYCDEKIKNYIIDIVFATRRPRDYKLDIEELVDYGASPRASIYLTAAAKAYAFIRGRGYVTPEDVKAIGMDVLRHRIILSYEAEAEALTPDEIVQRVFDAIDVP
ncbi:MAG: AAA family ATPase [Acidobacteriota bacterium]